MNGSAFRPRPDLLAPLLALLGAATASAQDDTYLRVSLRVTSARPGAAVVDRGARDRIESGDRVLLFPRQGGTYRGTVAQVDERSAVVELDDRTFEPEGGTRGEILVPRARVRPAAPVEPAAPEPEPPTELDHPPWEPRGDGWKADMPLLAQVRTVRPNERPSRMTGRVWGLGDYVRIPDDGRGPRGANSVARLGTDLRLDNPFGQGGAFRFDGELAHSTAFDATDATTAGVVRTLSYEIGGTRFAPNRFEFGRFVQRAMPEFGFVDGVEWDRRLEGGHRIGASIGFLPNPYDDLSTGDDFQTAVSFRYAADDLERLTFDLGYQKTWHHGDEDRDLFVLKSRWLPGDGWDVAATAWLDWYTGGEELKGRSLDLTQAWASVRRVDEDGAGWDLTWRRHSFPLTARDVLPPITPAQIADLASDRVSLEGFTGAPRTGRLRGELGGWTDDAEDGGYAEVGVGLADVFFDGDDLEVTGFGSVGRFTTIAGARAVLGRNTASGRWDVLYEAANHHVQGRDAGDDLLQHRLRASHSFFVGDGWSWAVHGEAVFWDRELSWSAGFHVQKSF